MGGRTPCLWEVWRPGSKVSCNPDFSRSPRGSSPGRSLSRGWRGTQFSVEAAGGRGTEPPAWAQWGGVRLGTRFSGHDLGLSLPLLEKPPKYNASLGQRLLLCLHRVLAWTGHTLRTGRVTYGLGGVGCIQMKNFCGLYSQLTERS